MTVWTVEFTNNAFKQLKKADKKLFLITQVLIEDLIKHGPYPGKKWANFGKLKGNSRELYHCHLIKGKPTYVCCWEVINKEEKIIEVYYVGTHEKAPY